MQANTKITAVNTHLAFQKVSLVQPSKSHFLHIAVEVDRPLTPFFLSMSQKKRELVGRCKAWCNALENEKGIISAVTFTARLIPPGQGKLVRERQGTIRIARFDVAVLIEADSKQKIAAIQKSMGYLDLKRAIDAVARATHIVTATNVRRIAAVDHTRQGVFLFNYFYADSLQKNLGIWEYTAGWFQQETGLDNSTVLLPDTAAKSHYAIINHCRWNKMRNILPSLLFKRSFHTYVLDNFYANQVAALPVLYRIA